MNTCTIYALTTCAHCKKAKQFLEEHNIPFECVYVDTLKGQERQETVATVRKYNPRVSFPTLVFNEGDKVIIGYEPEDMEEVIAK